MLRTTRGHKQAHSKLNQTRALTNDSAAALNARKPKYISSDHAVALRHARCRCYFDNCCTLFQKKPELPWLMAGMDNGGRLAEKALLDFRKFLGKYNPNAGIKCVIAGNFCVH
jgi:hypothetical protein